MRVCVFGAGALGSAIGGLLARHNEVTLVGRREHVSAISRKGLAITGDVRRRVRLEATEQVSDVGDADLLLVTTKAYDTEEAVSQCRSYAGGNTSVLTLQNGLGNLEILRAWKGDDAFGGTTTLGSALVRPGAVRISGLGTTIIGSDMNVSAARKIAEMFNESGIPSTTMRDVRSAIWSKAAINSSINPVTAILRVRNGLLFEGTWLARFVEDVADECVAVARAEGVPLDRPRIRARVRGVVKDTGGNISSMLQDVMRGKRTEIGQINGAFVRHGREHCVPTPLNRMLTAAVESMPLPARAKG